MIKLNSLRTITFLKSTQLFLRIAIFGFLLALFILSCTISNRIIVSDVANNEFLIGFYQVEVFFTNNNTALTISPTFIALLCVILIAIIASIVIIAFLHFKFNHVKNCFNKESILFIVSVVVMIVFIVTSFFALPNLDLNLNNKIDQSNAIFDIRFESIDQYHKVNLSYTKYGIVYLVLGSYMMFGIMYYPSILLYRLLKIKYI